MNYYLDKLLIQDIVDIVPIVVERYGSYVGLQDFDDFEKAFEEVFEIKARRRRYLLTALMKANILHDEGLSIILKGRKGVGKSTYAIKTVVQFFMEQDLSPGESYFEVLRRIIHTPYEFRLGINRFNDVLIWDDAGVWLSTYFWYDQDMRPYLLWFLNWYDTSRTTIHNLVFTTLTPKKLPPRIREDVEAVHARIRRVGSKKIDGRLFKVSTAHLVMLDESDYSLKILRQDLGEDQYIVYLPEPVYKIYWVIRKAYDILAEQKLNNILVQKGLIPTELGSNIP